MYFSPHPSDPRHQQTFAIEYKINAVKTTHKRIYGNLYLHLHSLDIYIFQLQKFGLYKNADGLEPAKGMLDIARQKDLYQNYLNQFLHVDCGLTHGKYS